MPEKDTDKENATQEQESGGGRSFWSGTIAFGLVSLPVELLVASRPSAVSFRMLDEEGTPLARRYFCSRDDEPLSRDDLVRGYEVEPDHFVKITDEELAALEPEKSREIDLRRFVPVDAIDPMYFERAYLLVPQQGATKAYRLLAESMESMGRAGIATFVMRGKEYLVAIIAERGVLRAETLRFHDELRTPADVGLPSLRKTAPSAARAMKQAITKLAAKRLDRTELEDESTEKLLELVEQKLESGKDVVHAPEAVDSEEGGEVVDLMEVLKKSLQGKARAAKASKVKARRTKTRAAAGKTKTR